MKCCKSWLAVLCSVLTLAPLASAQERTPTPQISEPGGILGARKYNAPVVAPIDLRDSTRIDSLLRAGNLYLSLQDAIALALENNLDIAISRYGMPEAQSDLQRAKAGGALRGVSQAVTQGPASAAGAAGGLSLNAFSNGSANIGTGVSTGVNGLVSQLGTAIPNYDPFVTGVISWGHTSSPQSTGFLYGTTSLVTLA